MNKSKANGASPGAMLQSLWANRHLIKQLARRDIVGRYKGALIGIAWSFVTPILMLAVYTFVFSVVFKARWGGATGDSRGQFALIMFVGMLVHGLFAEIINRAPGLVLANPNYVKKIVFPLEVLSPMVGLSALFHAAIGVIIFLLAFVLLGGSVSWVIIFLPLILLPLFVLAVGLAWFLASFGVYVRDVGQVTGIITTVMLFLAPVFYPLENLPQNFRWIVQMNPLTFIIQQAREVLVWGRVPDLAGLLIYLLVAWLVACAGFAWFQKTRKGFADVL